MLIKLIFSVAVPICVAFVLVLDLWFLIKPHARPELIKRLLLTCIVVLAVMLIIQWFFS